MDPTESKTGDVAFTEDDLRAIIAHECRYGDDLGDCGPRSTAHGHLRELAEQYLALRAVVLKIKTELDHPPNTTFEDVCTRNTRAWKLAHDATKDRA